MTLTPDVRDGPFRASGEAELPCVLAVFDGMGGESMGEFASLAAALVLAEHEERITSAQSGEEIGDAVREFVRDANGAICEEMRARSVRMGTTAALVAASRGAVYPYNLGDSRIYALIDGKLSRHSDDHTLAMQKVGMGLITEDEARTDRDRNRLTRHLGIFGDEMTVEAAASAPIPMDCGETGIRVLLCTDGLTGMLSDARIEEILREAQCPGDAADLLVDEALLNGGRDNVTCVVADFPRVSEENTAREGRGGGFFHKIKIFISRITNIFGTKGNQRQASYGE